MIFAIIWMFENSVLSTCEDWSPAWTADQAETVQVQLQSRFEGSTSSLAWFVMILALLNFDLEQEFFKISTWKESYRLSVAWPVTSLALVIKLNCQFYSTTAGHCNPSDLGLPQKIHPDATQSHLSVFLVEISRKMAPMREAMRSCKTLNCWNLQHLGWFSNTSPNPHSTIFAIGHCSCFIHFHWGKGQFQWSLWKRKVW